MNPSPDDYIIKPAEVTFIGYKKVLLTDTRTGHYNPGVLEVRITKGTLVGGYPYESRKLYRKLRAESLYTLRIFDLERKILKLSKRTEITSIRDETYKYILRNRHYPSLSFSRRLEECASGLHFFLSFIEAMSF